MKREAATTLTTALTLGCLLTLACEDPPQTKTASAASAEKPKKSLVIPVTEPIAEKKEEPKPKKKAEDCPDGNELELDSEEFESAIRLKLQKDKGSLTKADLGRLTSLNLSQMKMHELDICLFPHMKNLKELFLGPGDWDDLSPIEGLTKLETLGASRSKVSDLEPIAKMTHLDRLDIGVTQVKDLSPLEGLTRITELSMDSTPVEDVSPLSGMKDLEKLSIKRTQVKDVSPLKDLAKLKIIYVTDTPADEDPMNFAPLRANGTKVMND